MSYDAQTFPHMAEGGGLDPHSNRNRTISSRLREPSRFTLLKEVMMSDYCFPLVFSVLRSAVWHIARATVNPQARST